MSLVVVIPPTRQQQGCTGSVSSLSPPAFSASPPFPLTSSSFPPMEQLALATPSTSVASTSSSPSSTLPPAPLSSYTSSFKCQKVAVDQLAKIVLEETFAADPYPGRSLRVELGKKLHISPRSVQIWFQNRRQKQKREHSRVLRSVTPSIVTFTSELKTNKKETAGAHIWEERERKEGGSALWRVGDGAAGEGAGSAVVVDNRIYRNGSGRVGAGAVGEEAGGGVEGGVVVEKIKKYSSVDGIAMLFYEITVGSTLSTGELFLLSQHLEDGDVSGSTPLCTAVKFGNMAMTELLLKLGAQVDNPDRKLRSPLFLACATKNGVMVRFLLKNNANVNSVAKNRDTPLLQACKTGQFELAKLFLEQGANVKAIGTLGNTALHYAAAAGDVSLMELLLRYKPAINARDSSGHTPLFNACLSTKPEAARFLMANRSGQNLAEF